MTKSRAVGAATVCGIGSVAVPGIRFVAGAMSPGVSPGIA